MTTYQDVFIATPKKFILPSLVPLNTTILINIKRENNQDFVHAHGYQNSHVPKLVLMKNSKSILMVTVVVILT